MKNKILIGLAVILSGCATHIQPSSTENPPPAEKFSAFNCFELNKLQGETAEVLEQEAAMNKIQEYLNIKLQSRIDYWNKNYCTGQNRKTLVIAPTITELKFVGGGTRFFAGALAGSSAVVMKAILTEKETGKTVATPEFYAESGAYAGGWSVGGTDNAMLGRIANSLAYYVFTNYKEALGGPVNTVATEAEKIKTE